MKPILLLLGMLCLSAPAIPSFNQVERIMIFSHGGWMLNINQDGSGSLVYGSNGGDLARIPEKTFSFQEVYHVLIPHLSSSFPGANAIAVALYVKGLEPGTTIHALYLDDRKRVSQIMAEARAKSVPLDQNQFKELLLEHPLE
jgi:cephalosporin-C deacetylase-like acetyl esterase